MLAARFVLAHRVLTTTLSVLALFMLSATSAFATASFDFVSSAGQFTIANGQLSFGNGLTISSAAQDGTPDGTLSGAIVLLDPLILTGSLTSLPGGLTQVGVDSTQDYIFEIYQTVADGGELLLSAIYDPGEFLVIGASGIISAPIGDALSSINIAFPGFSPVLDELGETLEFIDFNVTLSAAGQNLAARIASGNLAAGSVAGTVATTPIPEPTTGVLMGLGLIGLAGAAQREGRRRE